MILLIDNYDSFTYNIYQYLCEMDIEVKVLRNDSITIDEISRLQPDHIIISPGPGTPEDAGISIDVVREFGGKIPILGICLGHQSIAACFGAEVIRAKEPFHGRISSVKHNGKGIFAGLSNPVRATRYHSLTVNRETLGSELEVTAESEDGQIMGLRHCLYSIEGVQFHPESIGTEGGRQMLRNFVDGGVVLSRARKAISRIHKGEFLTEDEAAEVMETITSGGATPAQISCILGSLSIRGETAAELTGFARVMRRKAFKVKKPSGIRVVDTCGTGGDSRGTFNISTVSALVAAGAGVCIAKHGNRSVTSKCGSADLLETLGVTISASPEVMERALFEHGISFLFAPGYHSSMKYAAPVRKEIGIRTAFNLLGPLSNPAGADGQVIGVYHKDLLEKIGTVLCSLGTTHSLVVHGRDGLDEISLAGPTDAVEVSSGWMRKLVIDPVDYGMQYCGGSDLKGGDRKRNAEIANSVLSGEHGPARDVVLLNAAAAILVGGQAETMGEAVALAGKSIDSGSAKLKLDQLVKFTGGRNELCS